MLKELSAALTQLIEDLIDGLARYGCGVTGMPYYEDTKKPTLGPFDANGKVD